ncbi:MAG: glutamine amidotransferase [Candidatus Daviesbacteria bacterium]
MKLIIGHLYPDLMNIYGDTGNIIALTKRAQWREIEVEIKNISVGDNLKKGEVDLFFFGGGQDQAQELVAQDLQKSGKGKIIKEEVERGVPLLAICGGYQLLGDYYQPHQGPKLPGVGLFPAYTKASYDRMIGNIVIKMSTDFRLQTTAEDGRLKTVDLLVGFENHSGKTYLKNGAEPLGKVIKGFGNNGSDQKEGCIYNNAVGCYLHGSLLPKNPHLADWLLTKALEVKYGQKVELQPLDDTLELEAHKAAVAKFG